MSILDTTFQYYPSNVKITKTLGSTTLRDFVESIRNPKEEIIKVFNQIAKYAELGDLENKNKLKQTRLFYVTPSVITNGNGRSYSDVESYNPLMVVEFDKISFAKELKEYLFNICKSVVAAFLSPSKTGCKFIVRIPDVEDAFDYKEYFCGIACHLDKIKGFDIANYNPLLPLFISWDPDILVRENPATWSGRGEKISCFPRADLGFKSIDVSNVTDINPKVIMLVKDRIRNLISAINVDGHSRIRSISLVAGGFVAYGYLPEIDMWDIIRDSIESNLDMYKNKRHYLNTAMHFLKKGQSSPLKF